MLEFMQDIFGNIIIPSNLIKYLLIVGTILLFIPRTVRIGRSILGISIILYFLFGSGPFAYWFLGSLENRHSALLEVSTIKTAKYIVVLGGYGEEKNRNPVGSMINEPTAYRLMEATRLHKINPTAEIILTGYGNVPILMKSVLESLGIDRGRVIVENRSLNTYDSAINTIRILGDNPFILVTSAGHMDRSIGVYRKFGLKPIPSPTDYKTPLNFLAVSYVPSPNYIRFSDMAVREYAALAWYQWNNRVAK